ncbi:PadR family transcriptional regulator [Sphingomonas sp. ASV193]|uniref:PadR family transcriptional regulator n=1 Tax=Sphingomonas sp. ASV193 TaxID=3144405 RepID=UPI0032E8749E
MPDTGFSDAQYLVLASLAGGPKHGHAMIDDIEKMSGSRLGPGTLYGAITRLEQQGWIEPLPFDERRKPYQLTASGRSAFTAKCKAMKLVVRRSAARLAAL